MARLNLLSPWMRFYNEMVVFFNLDPEVNIIYDDSGDTDKIKVYVNNPLKAEALTVLLPFEKTFGDITLLIEIIPSNKIDDNIAIKYNSNINSSKSKLLETALDKNEALSFIRTVDGIFSNPITYVVFKNVVVQYYDDSLSDIYGYCSTLYQEIAKNIFGEITGVFYCTDLPNKAKSYLNNIPKKKSRDFFPNNNEGYF